MRTKMLFKYAGLFLLLTLFSKAGMAIKLKTLSFLLLGSIICINTLAQPTIGRQRTMGGSLPDLLISIYLTRDGGLIAGGQSQSNISGEKTDSNRCGCSGEVFDFDYWVVKLGRPGNIQWDKTIGGSGLDYFSIIQQTSDGGYILGGSSTSDISGEKTENSRGNYDYWVVKLDSSGNVQWDKTIGGSDWDNLYALQQTSDGGYIMGGYSKSNISGEKTQNSRGGQDYWVVKLNSSGDIQWDKTIGGNGADALTALQQTSDGGYILGGNSASNISGEKTETSRGGQDYWLVKLNSSGTVQWDKTIGGNIGDKLTALQQTSDGGVILGGYSNSNTSGEKTQNSRGGQDYWVVKLNSSGTIQWDRTMGGNDYDQVTSLQQTIDGGYIIGGYSFSGLSGEKTEDNRDPSIVSDDYWVVKLTGSGIIQWDKTIGGSSYDYLTAIKEIKRNYYVLGGYSSSGISGEKTDTSRGRDDYWLVELKYTPAGLATGVAATTNADEINTDVFYAKIYPNPSTGNITVQYNNTGYGNIRLMVYDITGKAVFSKVDIAIKGNNTYQLDLSKLTPGVYHLALINGTEQSRVKFVLEK